MRVPFAHTGISPFRTEHWANESISERWGPAGYDPRSSASFLSAMQEVAESDNAAPMLRVPGAFEITLGWAAAAAAATAGEALIPEISCVGARMGLRTCLCMCIWVRVLCAGMGFQLAHGLVWAA